MKHVRAKFAQLEVDDPSPLVIDLLLGHDNTPKDGLPYAGWWGKPMSNNWFRPVVFRTDGSVDFGGDPEDPDEERFGRMPIHERSFDIGERFYLEDFEDRSVSVFQLRELVDLAEL